MRAYRLQKLPPNMSKSFWSLRYNENRTGWDIGSPSPPLAEYLDQLTDKSLRILIPGAGNAYEAEYAWKQGFTNVHVLDIAPEPLAAFQERVPDFPKEQLLMNDFFALEGQFDLILEQTFFCSFPPLPETRKDYAQQMSNLLAPGGKLAGVWFDIPLTGNMVKRPFGGTREEYLSYLEPYFKARVFQTATNSIKPRAGSELFGIFEKTE
jgi:SAM-dependent methyltransferase